MKVLLALALLTGPYLADAVRVRMFDQGESLTSAVLPTSFLVMSLSTDDGWPYGVVFDRLLKAPPRHAMWDWQLDTVANWCGECVVLRKDSAMAKRGVQIAGTIAGRGRDAAIAPLGDALTHPDIAIRSLALDVLTALGPRARAVRKQLQEAAKDGRDEVTRQRAAEILEGL